MARNDLRTIRLTSQEGGLIDAYLDQNPVFDSFSSLARVALLALIGQGARIHLEPVPTRAARPRFLWDYDLTEAQVREMLRQPGLSAQKKWLIARILTEARFEEVFRYLTCDEIARALPQLRLPDKIRERWSYALQRWRSRA